MKEQQLCIASQVSACAYGWNEPRLEAGPLWCIDIYLHRIRAKNKELFSPLFKKPYTFMKVLDIPFSIGTKSECRPTESAPSILGL